MFEGWTKQEVSAYSKVTQRKELVGYYDHHKLPSSSPGLRAKQVFKALQLIPADREYFEDLAREEGKHNALAELERVAIEHGLHQSLNMPQKR